MIARAAQWNPSVFRYLVLHVTNLSQCISQGFEIANLGNYLFYSLSLSFQDPPVLYQLKR